MQKQERENEGHLIVQEPTTGTDIEISSFFRNLDPEYGLEDAVNRKVKEIRKLQRFINLELSLTDSDSSENYMLNNLIRFMYNSEDMYNQLTIMKKGGSNA